MIARLYRLSLRAFPKRHRDLYQAEMIDAFERELYFLYECGKLWGYWKARPRPSKP